MGDEKASTSPGIPLVDPRLSPPSGSLGRQHDSKRETMPAYSFGTGSREAASNKVFISPRHAKTKPGVSPGPAYSIPTTVGASSKFSFGADEQRKHAKAQYPDTSVDLTCSMVDSQQVKFKSTPGVHFGTESRACTKNGELIRVNPPIALGLEAPGALEYYPERAEPNIKKMPPEYSFGPKIHKDPKKKPDPKKDQQKPTMRLTMLATGVPRHVGPGSHDLAEALGQQPQSARSTAPSYSFGSSPRLEELKKCGQVFECSPDLSSLGKQVVSTHKTMPKCTFGDATRDKVARSQLVTTTADRGPAAVMPKPHFHCELPKPSVSRPLAKAGL